MYEIDLIVKHDIDFTQENKNFHILLYASVNNKQYECIQMYNLPFIPNEEDEEYLYQLAEDVNEDEYIEKYDKIRDYPYELNIRFVPHEEDRYMISDSYFEMDVEDNPDVIGGLSGVICDKMKTLLMNDLKKYDDINEKIIDIDYFTDCIFDMITDNIREINSCHFNINKNKKYVNVFMKNT